MNHGDRVTADALLSMVMSGSSTAEPIESSIEGMSFGTRRLRAEEAARKAKEW